jgi:hypothetical protein
LKFSCGGVENNAVGDLAAYTDSEIEFLDYSLLGLNHRQPALGLSNFFFNALKTEGLAFVTALAVGEIVAAEGASVVVARPATLRAARAEVLREDWRSHLTALPRACADAVTRCAIQSLSRAVRRMREACAEGTTRCGRTRVAAERVADAAGGDVASARLRAGRVALEARRVRAESGWD